MPDEQNGGSEGDSSESRNGGPGRMPQESSFWATLPGIVKAITGLVVAITGLIAGLVAAGIIGGGDEPPTSTTIAAGTTLAPTSTSVPPTTLPPPATSTTTTTTTLPTTVTVPVLVGQTESDAVASLAQLGLRGGAVSEDFSEQEAGLVIATDPLAGDEVDIGTAVALVLSKTATPAEVYLTEFFAVGIQDSRLQPETTPRLWAALSLLDNSVTQHAAELEAAFLAGYENEPPRFEPPGYSPSDFAIHASDLEEDTAKLATSLAQFDLPPPAEVAELQRDVVERSAAVAAVAATMPDAISAEEKTSWPQARRHERREALIVLLRDLQLIHMDLEQICVILEPDHPECGAVVGVAAGPDPALAAYLTDLDEIALRVDRLEERSAALWLDWELATETLTSSTGLLDYLLGFLGEEGLWYGLGYPSVAGSEAAAASALVENLVVPQASPFASSHAGLLTAATDARTEVADAVHSFLHNRPRLRVQAMEGLTDALQVFRSAIDEACALAGSSYAVCID